MKWYTLETRTHKHANRMSLNLSYLLMNMKQLRMMNKRTPKMIFSFLSHSVILSLCSSFIHSFIHWFSFFFVYMSMHTHTKTALTNENDERELWPQHDHEIVYGVFLTFSSLSFPRTLLLWHQISCLSTVSIKIQHQYAPKWIESELINLNWAIGCITATATAVSRPFTAITLQRVHASAKKVHFLAVW